ncbi:SusC/RagA family TonB-linked outer membrane protein [Sphingobacterium gobiense]|uniref:SusC/RagA family TonB-linked outer membrane protein n=1 Tax=Sphingobacterium gobiense TaxID=1382456 RepID=A0A2S9JM74_9SPHI|nr:SusC/RagA family TonB-linked outer membrane protein [Sphingobacterium gobiense]PRD54099.1 SusC/RagA family TonB-linked outer membrane protein [Sphingobacterium gobiense]
MKQKLLSMLFVLTCLVGYSLAQTRQVGGKVTSASDGTPISGVSVAIVGTSTATQTDENGDYGVSVTNGGTLSFTSIGYAAKRVTIGNESTINVTLQSLETSLDEVLVVAYGTVDKHSHVGSSAQINSKEFENRPLTNVTSALVGSAPGVQGTLSGGAPGSGAGIRVRGFGSINASNDPLYVVDGIPYDAGTANLNPDDIESIAVLKDAATTALYGSRGANGVIMVTTKKGKVNQNNFTVNASAGIIRRGLPEYDRIDAFDYYPLMWESLKNSLLSAGVPDDVARSIASGNTTSYEGNTYSGIYSQLGYNPFNVPNNEIVDERGMMNPNAQLLYGDDLDWAKAIQTGGRQRQAYGISYDGGSDKTTFYANLGYTNDQGYLLKSDLKRIIGRVNVNTQATDWLRGGFNLTANYSDNKFDNADGNTSIINPFYVSRYIGPIYPIHQHDPVTGAYVLDEFGNRQYDFGDNRPFTPGRNTIYENQLDSQNDIRSAFGGRTFLEFQILPQLKATTNIGLDVQDTHERLYDNPIIGDGSPAGRAYHYFYRTTSYTWNQLLEFDQAFGKHRVNVMAGHENYAYKYNYLSGSRSEMIVDGITELPNFASVLGTTSYEHNRTIESFFGRGTYDFDRKYVLNGSLRRDGNSRFHRDFRWATFWSIGGAWNISEEDFINSDKINFLKLRASYGTVGNDAGIGNYPYQALYTLGRNNADKPGLTQRSLPNDSITWETSKNFDIGIDFEVLDRRLRGSVEYFDRKTDGLIFAVPMALIHGGVINVDPYYHTVDQNIGNMYNRGLELTLTADVVRGGDFNYSTTLNLTHQKNKITEMPPGQPLIQNGTKGLSVGHSIYDFHLREFYGVDPDNGDALYRTNQETDNTRIIGNDTLTTVLGEANLRYVDKTAIPDVYGSMRHDLGYKGFSLSLMFTFQLGGHIYDSGYASLMSSGGYGNAKHIDIMDRWQQTGDVTDIPRMDAGATANLNGQSTRFLTSASYLNLNTIVLGYNLPQSVLGAINMKDCYVYLSGENLGLLSARKGMNVVGSFNGTVSNSYNFNSLFTVGTRIKF